MIRRRLVSTIAMVVLGIAGAGAAPSVETDLVKVRLDAMEDAGRAFKKLAAIAKKQAPYDAAAVKGQAGTILERLNTTSTLFPTGSDKGKTKTLAKAEVWTDAAGFDAAMKASVSAAGALQKAEGEAAFGPAFGSLGASCKACHEKYRLSKH